MTEKGKETAHEIPVDKDLQSVATGENETYEPIDGLYDAIDEYKLTAIASGAVTAEDLVYTAYRLAGKEYTSGQDTDLLKVAEEEISAIRKELIESLRSEVPLAKDLSLDDLVAILTKCGVPIDKYGTGAAKTIQHLLAEIESGESVVTIGGEKGIKREVGVLLIDVVCELSNGNVYLLKEDRQEFKDGRVRRRQLDSSIGEKLKRDEDPETAVSRALSEELGVTDTQAVYNIGHAEQTSMTETYPGVESTYEMHQFVTVLPEAAFKPDGYIEYQDDKTNYYIWEPVHTAGDISPE